MKNLSSDRLYYSGLIGLIIAPFIYFLFVQVILVNNFSGNVINIVYCILFLFLLAQWYKLSKTRKVFKSGYSLLLKTYFTNKTIEVPVKNVTKIKKVFSLRMLPTMYYKIVFVYNDKKATIYFFKAMELYGVKDLIGYIGIRDDTNK